MSAKLVATLRAAQAAVQAKSPDYPSAFAKLQEAETDPEKTPYDEHIINELSAFAYSRTGQLEEAAKANEALINDGFCEQSEIPQRLKLVAVANYQLRNYEKAVDYGNRALARGYSDQDILVIISQAYYLAGRYDGVRDFLGKQIRDLETQGQAVPQPYVDLLLSSCSKLGDLACLVAYGPDKRNPLPLDHRKILAPAGCPPNDSAACRLLLDH